MPYTLRTIALLMLVAGICLGVFAGTLMAGKDEPAPPNLDQWVEERVRLYRADYDLDVETTDAIRRELQRHRRALWDMMMDLRRRHQEEFSRLRQETEARLQGLLAGSAASDR
jgi:hypothetical protein